MQTTTDVLTRVQALVSDELGAVQQRMDELVASKLDLVPAVYRHALKGGGKKIRPTLVLLCARLAEHSSGAPGDRQRLVDFATAVELVHVASLLHDDVADEAETRRGLPAANRIWHNKVCVFVADFLISSTYRWLCTAETADLLRILCAAINEMCEGELLQTSVEGNPWVSESEYFEIIRGKTASLMAACCEIGAVLGGADESEAARLREFGLHFGCAFQITDDLLDIVGTREELGKDPGADLRAGRFTLPLIRMLALAPRAETAWLVEEIESQRQLTDGKVERALQLAVRCGAVDSCRRSAEEYIGRAKQIVGEFAACAAGQALSELCDFLLWRRR